MVNYIEDVLEEAKRARAEPLSETHDNSTYEGTKDSKSVYIKAPFKALIDCKRSNGYYYPEDNEAKVFISGK